MLDKIFVFLHILPMAFTAAYFLGSTRVYQNLKRIKKENGLFITIVFMILSVGCWQLFWLIHLSPAIADNMKRY